MGLSALRFRGSTANTVVADQGTVKIGSYTAQCQPWGGALAPVGQGPFQPFVDYHQWLNYNAANFPSNIGFYWNLPGDSGNGKPPGLTTGVFGYNFVAFNDYLLTNPAVLLPYIRVNNLNSAFVQVLWDASGTLNGYDVEIDFFLFDVSIAGQPVNRKFELEQVFHIGPNYKTFVDGLANQLGTYVDDQGISWKAAYSLGTWTILFMYPLSGQDIKSYRSDLKRILLWGVDKGIVDPTWYLPGFAVGAENVNGSGWLRLKQVAMGMT